MIGLPPIARISIIVAVIESLTIAGNQLHMLQILFQASDTGGPILPTIKLPAPS
jgi:hypothetical protein